MRMKTIILLLALVIVAGMSPAIAQTPNRPNASGKINLNTATVAQLTTLPGIGPRIAERIITYRKQHGPFKRIEEIMNVRGVGRKVFQRIRDHLTVK